MDWDGAPSVPKEGLHPNLVAHSSSSDDSGVIKEENEESSDADGGMADQHSKMSDKFNKRMYNLNEEMEA